MKVSVFSLKGQAKRPFTIASIVLLAIYLTGVLQFSGPLTVTYAAPAEWSGNSVQYKVGDKVTYQGQIYICIQAHTSEADWAPANVPALWQFTTDDSSSSSPIANKSQLLSPPPSHSTAQTFTGDCTAGIQDMWTSEGGVFFQGRKDLHQVALTFDDGPFGPDNSEQSNNTRAVLNILEKYKIHATFFVIGEQVTSDPQQIDPTQTDPNADQVKLISQEKKDGDEVADHTWTHPDLTVLPLTPDPNNPGNKHDVQDEIQMTATVIQNAIGTTPEAFRPPFGATNEIVQQQASQQGLTTVGWTIDSCDWTQTLSGGAQKNDIVNNVLNYVTNGSIVLMHDGGNDRSQTVAALPTIIQSLKNQGYQFVTVQQMITEAAQQ